MEEREATPIEISERLQQWLVPVEPPLAFVRSLKMELIEVARRQYQRAHRMQRIMVMGAVIASSVTSVAGFTVFLILRRRARAHPPG